MSTFAVRVEKIADIGPAKNSDNLSYARLEGKDYEFVVGRGEFESGETAIYFPVDSILPEELVKLLGLEKRLKKGRIKTMKLRGNLSQGLVIRPDVVAEIYPEVLEYEVGDDVTDIIGVEKYEAPVKISNAGRLVPLPDTVTKYDIEGAQNYQDVVNFLMDQVVYISEKLEGSHFGVSMDTSQRISGNPEEDWDRVEVFQRNFKIEPIPEKQHSFHRAAREYNIPVILDGIASLVEVQKSKRPARVTIRGEYIGPGVQKNIYKLDKNEFRLFDMEIDGTPADALDFLFYMDLFGLPVVPVFSTDKTLRQFLMTNYIVYEITQRQHPDMFLPIQGVPYNEEENPEGKTLRMTVKQAGDGLSLLNPEVMREGIVIKPLEEQRHPEIGRLMLKQRGVQYLAETGL